MFQDMSSSVYLWILYLKPEVDSGKHECHSCALSEDNLTNYVNHYILPRITTVADMFIMFQYFVKYLSLKIKRVLWCYAIVTTRPFSLPCK